MLANCATEVFHHKCPITPYGPSGFNPIGNVKERVIVMTFWYIYENGLTFFELFKLYFHLGLITTPLCSLHSHDLCLFPFHVSFFTRSHGQEKSLLYYDLFNFRVLFYGRTPTLILFYFLHNPTTPILPVYVDQQWSYLQEDTTWSRSMVKRKIPRVPRRTLFGPD